MTEERYARAVLALAEKVEAKSAMEVSMGYFFPRDLFIRGRWLKFRLDASDATGIALYGVKQRDGAITFADSFKISAPGLPRVRYGKPYEAPTPIPLEAPLVAEDTPVLDEPPIVEPDRDLPDAFQCTLCAGCTLGVNHAGLCRFEFTAPRTPKRLDFAALAGKRSSPGSGSNDNKRAKR